VLIGAGHSRGVVLFGVGLCKGSGVD